MDGVDGPTGAANAGPQFAAECNIAPLFLLQDDTPRPGRSIIQLKY